MDINWYILFFILVSRKKEISWNQCCVFFKFFFWKIWGFTNSIVLNIIFFSFSLGGKFPFYFFIWGESIGVEKMSKSISAKFDKGKY